MHVFNGHRPDRPKVGFSDPLWRLLENSWRDESERPPISLLRTQLEQDGGAWVSAVGMSRANTGLCRILSVGTPNLHPPQADDMSSFPPVGDADPGLQVLFKQAQELLSSVRSSERPAAIPAPATVAPDPTTVHTPVIAPPPVPTHRVPPKGPQKAKGVRAGTRRKFREFRDRFKLLLAKFTRASRGPITLSRGLVSEREENAELTEKRHAKLFSQLGHVQSEGAPPV